MAANGTPGNEKIVEQTTTLSCGSFDALRVFGHETIDGQVVAQAAIDDEGDGVGTVAVAGEHVTRIESDEPYDEVSYGTVVKEEVSGGETIYYVEFGDARGVRPCKMGEDGCRIVTKPPSWVPKPTRHPNAGALFSHADAEAYDLMVSIEAASRPDAY
ncbi:unnamed protein product [Pelagomonas calceolata]|uniref:Uncharacterized protein n=1 Tax=Pelagomonas calceolata TaxID=35677 RepID=A0A8J2SWC8_9STRA|nr:unnamed protein product [Pelagomonas calceolata]